MSGPTAPCEAVKKTVDDFLVANHARLNRIAASCTKGYGGRQLAHELFSYLVEELYSGRQSVAEVAADGPDNLMRWSTNLMRISASSGRSAFRRSWKKKLTDDVKLDDSEAEGSREAVSRALFEEGHYHEQPEVPVEPRSFYERELLEKGLSPEDAKRLVAVEACKHCLPPHMQRLYALYFEGGLSIRGVAERVGLPQTSVFIQVRLLRERIRQCVESNPKPLL